MENLFSYGTLQIPKVQIENFGRTLKGSKDIIQYYCLEKLEIKDANVLRVSEERYHPILIFTGSISDEVSGTVFKITSRELLKTDEYEVKDYKRIRVVLKSGSESWVYVRA